MDKWGNDIQNKTGYSKTFHNNQGPNLYLLRECFLKTSLQHASVLWHYVDVVGSSQWRSGLLDNYLFISIKKYGQNWKRQQMLMNGPSLIHPSQTKLSKFIKIIVLQWILKYICATILKSLCFMEISILVVVVIWDLIFITLFLATIKFHFQELCFLSRTQFFPQKYSLFLTEFSNTNHFQLPGRYSFLSLFCIVTYSL